MKSHERWDGKLCTCISNAHRLKWSLPPFSSDNTTSIHPSISGAGGRLETYLSNAPRLKWSTPLFNWGLPFRTSAKISDFFTPSPLVCKFTQPLLLRLLTMSGLLLKVPPSQLSADVLNGSPPTSLPLLSYLKRVRNVVEAVFSSYYGRRGQQAGV